MHSAIKGSRSTLLPRHALSQVRRRLGEMRVVVVNGPRQAGKTTLARLLHPEVGGTFATLDDPDQLMACREDPRTFVDRPRPVIIDEFQRAGDDLLMAIKVAVDQDPTPGRFLLTGSTRFLTVPTISESLAGRVAIIDLWPFSQGEADQLGPTADSLLPRLFDGAPLARALEGHDLPSRREYLQRLCRGGYPQVQGVSSATRRRFFADYVRAVTQRDVPEISRIRHVGELRRILELLAGSTGQELYDARLARELEIDRRTLRANYLPLLHTVYLTVEVAAWSRRLVARVAKHPKSYLVDTGLAAHLIGADAERLAEPTSVSTGPLVETFAVNELIRQTARFDDLGARLFHYRAGTGTEIDVIIETPGGRVAAVEVKAATSVRPRDLRHLSSVRDRLDELPDQEFVRGVVLTTGDQALPMGDRLEVLPLAALWLPPRTS